MPLPFALPSLRSTRARLGLAIGALVVAGAVVAAAGGTDMAAKKSSSPAVNFRAEAQPGTANDSVVATVDAAGVAAGAPPVPAPLPAPESKSAAAGVPSGGGLVPAAATAKVVRTDRVAIQVRKHAVPAATDAVTAIAGKLGGYVASSSRAAGSSPSAQIDMRIPVDRFDDARKELRETGSIRNETLTGEDVTSQLVDLDARLRSLQAEEETLRALVGQAKTVGEVLQVQPQLFDVRTQIEQLQASRQQLDQRASLATFSVAIAEHDGASLIPKPASSQPVLARSFSRAARGSLEVLGGMVIVLGYALPIGALVALGWWATRRRRSPIDVPPASPAA